MPLRLRSKSTFERKGGAQMLCPPDQSPDVSYFGRDRMHTGHRPSA
jgi:hypothetical protein